MSESIGINMTIRRDLKKRLKELSDKFIFIPIFRAVKPPASPLSFLLFSDARNQGLT